jgi:hypothetical protein
MERLGSDQSQLASFGGGVISEEGAVLLSGESTGGSSLLFGPAALREIQANVANGDFAIPPLEALDTVDDTTNPLPYFTGVATGAAPTVTAAITASALTASGNVLTFTAAANAGVGSAYEIKRYVPISGGSNRASAYHPEVNVGTTTGGATDKTRVRITITATACDADLNALTVTATANGTASTITSQSLFTNWIVPDAKAAFILLSVKVDVPTTSPVAAVTMPVTEVRLARSEGAISFPALQNPSGDQWIIQNENLQFEIFPQTELDPSLTMVSNGGGGTYSIDLTANNIDGTLQLTGNGWATLSGGITTVEGEFVDILSDNSVDIESGADDIYLKSGTSDVIVQDTLASNGTNPRIMFRDKNNTTFASVKSGAANVIQILNGASATDYAQLWAERIYPMNGSTASRYMYDTGTVIGFSSGGDFNGSLNVSGSMVSDAISTTTQTASAAIWVLSSGTTYSLRRNSSSARYKTNIVDADDAVLEAARRITARHYESTIADEGGATRLGFIAEEVHDAGLTHAVGYDAEGRPESLDSTALIAALWHRVADLESRLQKLENENG